MSFFSRLFRKASSAPVPSPVASGVPSAPTGVIETAAPKPGAVERAQAAALEEKALQAAIDARDFQAVARLVVAGASTKVRQAAAEAVDDPELLRQLLREVRGGNDKSVYKILAAKRDAQLEQARKQAQLQAEVDAAARPVEQHSRRAYDAAYGSLLLQFESRWQAVAAQADPELRGKVEQWLDGSRETVAEHSRQTAERAAQAQAAAAADAEAEAKAERLRDQQAQESAASAGEEAQAQAVEPPQPALIEHQQAEQKAIRQVGESIRKARHALSAGHTARAAAMRRDIEEELAGAPLPASLAGQLQQLDRQLAELKEWKSFSVAPKRAELIEAMELLVGAPLEPTALAERIRSLRDAWRTLGRGAGIDQDVALDADEQRFQEVARQAYQPCAEFFAAQALVLKENLQRREAVLAGLVAFEAGTDWDAPGWQGVINTLRETKQAWRAIAPLEPHAARQQQERFSAVVAGLQGRVDAEHARNVAQKESLIERARQLLAGDDSGKAIDAVKALQRQWQTVGPVPREVDQRLWGEFRQHCDAVFQKRQQEAAAVAAGLDDNKAQAVALCEQVEKIAALEGPELLAGAGALPGLRSAFDALRELPRAETRALRDRLDQGLERCRKAMARQQQRDAERNWNDLFEAADRVRAYRLAVVRGASADELEPLKAATEAFIAAVDRWPKGGLDVMRQELGREPSSDLAANEAALRLLCIRAEIAADLPTPPEDQAVRRDHQLQRLVQGMGQRAKADEQNLDGMAMEWVRAGPVEALTYQGLQQRFLACRSRSGSGNS